MITDIIPFILFLVYAAVTCLALALVVGALFQPITWCFIVPVALFWLTRQALKP